MDTALAHHLRTVTQRLGNGRCAAWAIPIRQIYKGEFLDRYGNFNPRCIGPDKGNDRCALSDKLSNLD